MGAKVLDAGAVQALEEAVKGEVLTPASAEYDEARRVFNAMIDKRPAVIVRCVDPHDVMAAIDFARASALDVSVRSSGHGVTGTAVCDDGIVIDVSRMKRIRLDPEARTVRAQPGVTWGELDAKTQEVGLAVTGGRVSSTGIAGLTLGSGSGWLERSLGFACDNLISADVVTADGSFVRASESEHSELFWGLRGGGGNFGVVTQLEFRLHPVGPMLLGGMLMFPIERGREVLRFYRDMIADAPDQLGGAPAVITAPPLDFVPEHVRGSKLLGLIVVYAGDPTEGEQVVRPLRELGPAMDMVATMPYTAVQQLIDPMNQPGALNYWKADLLGELSDEAIDAFLDAGVGAPSPTTMVLLQPLGGAIARAVGGDTPLAHRDAGWVYHALAVWHDPEASDAHVAWARRVGTAMAPFTTAAPYLTYSSDSGEPDRVRSTFGDNYARLVAVKDRYDPSNMFRINQNIPPSTEALVQAERGS